MGGIDELEQAPRKIRERRVAWDRVGTALIEFRREPVFQRVGVLPHLALLVAIDAGDLLQHMRKAGRP